MEPIESSVAEVSEKKKIISFDSFPSDPGDDDGICIACQ